MFVSQERVCKRSCLFSYFNIWYKSYLSFQQISASNFTVFMVLQELLKAIHSFGWSIWIVMTKIPSLPQSFKTPATKVMQLFRLLLLLLLIFFSPTAPIQQARLCRITYHTCNIPRCNLSLVDNKTVAEMRVFILKFRHFNAVHLRFPCRVINV